MTSNQVQKLKLASFSSLLLGAMLLLGGCIVTSVYPFYDAKSLSFEPRLLGQWNVETDSGEASEQWTFEQETNHSFKVSYVNNQTTSVMQGHTFKLKGELFLDLFTTDIDDEHQPPPIPAHMVVRLVEVGTTMRMVPMNYEWLGELLEKNPKALRHHIICAEEKKEHQRLVLTADTPELQRFLVAHLKTSEAWKGESKLRKKT